MRALQVAASEDNLPTFLGGEIGSHRQPNSFIRARDNDCAQRVMAHL